MSSTDTDTNSIGDQSVFSAPEYDTATCSSSPEIIDHTNDHSMVSNILKYEDSKTVFVEALVASAVLLIETLWPTSTPRSKSMPLRRFIQETLKRSRTSYSTFQVSLYYLILVKPFIFEQIGNDTIASTSPLGCARRTFLASLMLASKCLQDRNYSVSAWSKISGLSIKELSANELYFLKAADWKLHMSQETYNRWSTLLLVSASEDTELWKARIRNIGPDLIVQDRYLSCDPWEYIMDLTSVANNNKCALRNVTPESSKQLSVELPISPPYQCSSPPTGAHYMTSKDEWRFIRASLAAKQGGQPLTPTLSAITHGLESKRSHDTAVVCMQPTDLAVTRIEHRRSVDLTVLGMERRVPDMAIVPVERKRRFRQDIDVSVLDIRPAKQTALANRHEQ
jgi:hypothetical protein